MINKKYISLWNEFIADYFPDKVHKEKSILEQLKQHVDYGQLSKELVQKIRSKEEGAYFVLRINRDRTSKLHERINIYFGKGDYHISKEKIVDISEYYKIGDMLSNLDVSAYKGVRLPKRNKK